MNIVNCDKCGKQVNKPHCNANSGESEKGIPSNATLTEGTDKDNCTEITPTKELSYDLCRQCFGRLRGIVTKFFMKSY